MACEVIQQNTLILLQKIESSVNLPDQEGNTLIEDLSLARMQVRVKRGCLSPAVLREGGSATPP